MTIVTQSMVVLREVEVDLPWLWACLPLVLALIYLVVGLLPLGLMLGFCNVVFLVHFRYIFHVTPTCPPVIDESPKLVESC